jgi:7-keto-8-aminopelargonate synthetase-like enzyme
LQNFINEEDAILYISCFNVNAEIFETILKEQDYIISVSNIKTCYINPNLCGIRNVSKEMRRKEKVILTRIIQDELNHASFIRNIYIDEDA